VRVHSDPGDMVLDPFAGSGTAGDAAARHGRGFVLIDSAAEAVETMRRRLAAHLSELVSGNSVSGPSAQA
jgi:site-specific DNA-methyltransferase (adenine-specific)